MAASTHSATTSSSDLSKPPQPHNDAAPAVDAAQFDDKGATEKDVVEQQEKDEAVDDSLGRELSRIDTSDFPSAFPLAMITVALMLSIFLCALGKPPPSCNLCTRLTLYRYDNCCNGHPAHHRSIPFR